MFIGRIVRSLYRADVTHVSVQSRDANVGHQGSSGVSCLRRLISRVRGSPAVNGWANLYRAYGAQTMCLPEVRLSRHDLVGPHHFVVFVFQGMAVPHIAAAVAFEAHDNTRGHFGCDADYVLPSFLAGAWWNARTQQAKLLSCPVGTRGRSPRGGDTRVG